MFFKRLSRGSRSNSYVIDDDNYNTSRSAPQEDSPRQSLSQHNTYNGTGGAASTTSPTKESQRPESQDKMFARSQAPADPYSRAQQPTNGMATGRNSIAMEGPASTPKPVVAAPDLLTQAFHQVVLPYTDKIADLEAQVAEMQQWVENLEQQRAEVHSWIDKRGLRPGMSLTQFCAIARDPQYTRLRRYIKSPMSYVEDSGNLFMKIPTSNPPFLNHFRT
jgi:hypothetical protein